MNNPWLVENLQSFVYINCPECVYKSKEEASFQQHAISHHPNSLAFFGKAEDVIISEQDVAIENILEFKNEPIDPELAKTSIDISHVKPVEFIVKVLDQGAQRQTITTTPLKNLDHQTNIITSTAENPSFFGTRRRKKRSVQALIDILNELGDEKYACALCPRAFVSVKDMKEHCKEEHEGPEGKIKCQYCDAEYSGVRLMNRHIRRKHVKLPKKQCKICGKWLEDRQFKRHVEIVHEIDKSKKNYKCEHCDYTSYHPRYISDHKSRVHPKHDGTAGTGKTGKIYFS